MIIRVIDCETTGFDHERDGICEIACVDILMSPGSLAYLKVFETFVDPEMAIPPSASAIHHITDDMVASAPKKSEAIEMFSGADFYAAHNDRFDRRFLGDFGKPWIDTYRCALRAFPDMESHSNQYLRYALGLKDLPPIAAKVGSQAHRALYDAAVTSRIFFVLFSKLSFEEMLKISREPAILPRVTFGKHQGQRWQDVPYDYLDWMRRQGGWDEDVSSTLFAELQRRAKERISA